MPLTQDGQLFGWSLELWTLLDQIGILVGLATPILTVLLAVVAWARRDELRAWLRGNRFPGVGRLIRSDARWAAVLFTVSRADLPDWVMKRTRPTTG